jgi:hypothetical protein
MSSSPMAQGFAGLAESHSHAAGEAVTYRRLGRDGVTDSDATELAIDRAVCTPLSGRVYEDERGNEYNEVLEVIVAVADLPSSTGPRAHDGITRGTENWLIMEYVRIGASYKLVCVRTETMTVSTRRTRRSSRGGAG